MSTVSKATVILPNLTGHYGWSNLRRIRSQCSDPSFKRGFSPRDGQPKKKQNSSADQKKVANLRQRKLTNRQFGPFPGSPGLSESPGKSPSNDLSDLVFEERLKAARRSALKQKKAQEEKELGAIDYDATIEKKQSTAGLGTKVGVGVAVLVFGLVFAVGDFLPSGSISSEDAKVTTTKLSQEERAVLETRLKQFQATLGSSPKDPVTLEGAAVTLAELGEYTQAANLLNDLSKEKPNDPDVFRLIGEVKYELRDYKASVTAYKKSLKLLEIQLGNYLLLTRPSK